MDQLTLKNGILVGHSGQTITPEDVNAALDPSPSAARRISREELRFLISVLDREIGYSGLSEEAGRRSRDLRDKLRAIHREGWQ